MTIETRLANASFTNVADNDEVKTYNKMSREELSAFAPGMNWSRLFSSLGRPDMELIHLYVVSEAKNLLTAGEQSIAEIAYQLGFENPPGPFLGCLKKKSA